MVGEASSGWFWEGPSCFFSIWLVTQADAMLCSELDWLVVSEEQSLMILVGFVECSKDTKAADTLALDVALSSLERLLVAAQVLRSV